jgi:hypothetical protein
MSVATMLKKEKEGTLYKRTKLGADLEAARDKTVHALEALREGNKYSKALEDVKEVSSAVGQKLGLPEHRPFDKFKEWGKALQTKTAGKYGKNSAGFDLQGKTEVQGLPIAIENRVGSVREGKNDDGSKWRTKFRAPYGYIEGTKGADGDEIDAYVGPDKSAPKAFVVHQKKSNGSHDEDTVMLGFRSKGDAKKCILKHYEDKSQVGSVDDMSVETLQAHLARADGKKISKLAFMDESNRFLRKMIIGGVAGAAGGLGHELIFPTRAIPATQWSQALNNKDPDAILVGGKVLTPSDISARQQAFSRVSATAKKGKQLTVSKAQPGERVVASGRNYIVEVPRPHKDVAGRVAPLVQHVDRREGSPEELLSKLRLVAAKEVDGVPKHAAQVAALRGVGRRLAKKPVKDEVYEKTAAALENTLRTAFLDELQKISQAGGAPAWDEEFASGSLVDGLIKEAVFRQMAGSLKRLAVGGTTPAGVPVKGALSGLVGAGKRLEAVGAGMKTSPAQRIRAAGAAPQEARQLAQQAQQFGVRAPGTVKRVAGEAVQGAGGHVTHASPLKMALNPLGTVIGGGIEGGTKGVGKELVRSTGLAGRVGAGGFRGSLGRGLQKAAPTAGLLGEVGTLGAIGGMAHLPLSHTGAIGAGLIKASPVIGKGLATLGQVGGHIGADALGTAVQRSAAHAPRLFNRLGNAAGYLG